VQSILAREKDLALALKTEKIRIQPNIPGKSLVGLKAPVPNPTTVTLRQIIEGGRFGEVSKVVGMPIALGQDVGGNDEVLDLRELPHLLIAGATGTGKSVCLNTIVASMLLTHSDEQLRLLMVDPNGVARIDTVIPPDQDNLRNRYPKHVLSTSTKTCFLSIACLRGITVPLG
jgi:S-DNA-T family DNA segregation ATPase FtsK/SpoIIIE